MYCEVLVTDAAFYLGGLSFRIRRNFSNFVGSLMNFISFEHCCQIQGPAGVDPRLAFPGLKELPFVLEFFSIPRLVSKDVNFHHSGCSQVGWWGREEFSNTDVKRGDRESSSLAGLQEQFCVGIMLWPSPCYPSSAFMRVHITLHLSTSSLSASIPTELSSSSQICGPGAAFSIPWGTHKTLRVSQPLFPSEKIQHPWKKSGVLFHSAEI